MQSSAILFSVSFALCFVIIISSRYGFSRRADLDVLAIQSAHTRFVPRVGGLAVYISILGLIPLLSFGFIPISVVFDLSSSEVSWLILSASPIFLIGLAEDLGYPMSPKTRLITSAVSSLLTLYIFKIWILMLGVPGIDYLLTFTPFAISFTVFATVGVVNAFNLIDGLNGLSGYISISTASALGFVAFQVGNIQVAIFLMLITASVLGFLILNFPLGKIFLGDGGAYVLGHLLVWSSILLIDFSTLISPFAVLLIFFWPVADTGLAIWRRWKLGNPADRPDRLHFHQLAMRFLEIRFLGRYKRHMANPIATVVLVPLISVPQVLGVVFWDNFYMTVWCTFFVGSLFIFSYIVGINLAKKSRGTN